MNIFVTSSDPVKAAYNLDDRRVVKMCLESAQILSTVLWLEDTEFAQSRDLYKPCYVDHPCTRWAAETDSNYEWLYLHYYALCELYSKVYGKIHASALLYDAFLEGKELIVPGGLTSFAKVAGNREFNLDYNWVQNPIAAYRYYLSARWQASDPKWTGRERPLFYHLSDPIGSLKRTQAESEIWSKSRNVVYCKQEVTA